MSIMNGGAERAEDEPPPTRNILAECVDRLYSTVGFSYGRRLSEHAAGRQHEDVAKEDIPSDAVKIAERHTISQVPPPLSITTFESRCPDRLRPLIPPPNFGAVVPEQIYRSSYPKAENFTFLKTLGLKTILTLVPEEIPAENAQFIAENGIQHFQVHIPANKEKMCIPTCQMSKALGIVLDRSNHPILIHCNKGKHRTGCVVGCFRKVQGEYLDTIFEEYHAYADPKARILDECFIEVFDDHTVLWMARLHNWTPLPSPDSVAASAIPTLSVARPRA